MRLSKEKIRRRLSLLDDLIDLEIRSNCRFAFCDGPLAPVRYMKTCCRCTCIHRAIQMGLVKPVKESYMGRTREGNNIWVNKGSLEQFSAVNGDLVR